jgi:hypothetical protein
MSVAVTHAGAAPTTPGSPDEAGRTARHAPRGRSCSSGVGCCPRNVAYSCSSRCPAARSVQPPA